MGRGSRLSPAVAVGKSLNPARVEACNEGRSNLQTATESARNLLARIRRCSRGVQIEVATALYRQYRQYLEDLDAAGSGESE
jgi:hypothetical protein